MPKQSLNRPTDDLIFDGDNPKPHDVLLRAVLQNSELHKPMFGDKTEFETVILHSSLPTTHSPNDCILINIVAGQITKQENIYAISSERMRYDTMRSDSSCTSELFDVNRL